MSARDGMSVEVIVLVVDSNGGTIGEGEAIGVKEVVVMMESKGVEMDDNGGF